MRNLVGIATFLSLTMVSGYLSADDSVEAVGQKIYASYCSVCHDSGLAGAPRLGIQADWQARISKGKETLREHVLNGFNAMPPKGTCATCSDDDLWAAMDHMLRSVE